jgi:mpaB/rubber oxygenase-like protein
VKLIQCTDQCLEELSGQGDEEADPVAIKYLKDRRAEPAHLFRAAAAIHYLPPEAQDADLAAYLNKPSPLPTWACRTKLAAGSQFFADWMPEIGLGLLCFSLPTGYAAASFAQVLHVTGRLESDAQRRVFESARMVEDVTAPGGLEPGGPGHRTARRVRLMHAAVRQLMLNDKRVVRGCSARPEENFWPDDWGMPISQEQLLGGVLAFGWSMLSVLDRLGVRYDERGAEGYLHLWDVVAYYLGVRPDLLPIGRSCAEALDPLFRARNFAPSTAGHRMTAALIDVLDRMGHDIVLPGLPVSMMRLLLGDEVARMAGVPPANWTLYLVRDLRPLLQRLSLETLHHRSLRVLVRRTFRPLMRRIVEDELHDRRPTFEPPTHLAEPATVAEEDRDAVIDLTGKPPRPAPIPPAPTDVSG